MPDGAANYRCVCGRFASDIFFRSFPFVIHAKAALANGSTGILRLQLSMNHRIKSVVTLSESGFP